jgi:hypothetical protein
MRTETAQSPRDASSAPVVVLQRLRRHRMSSVPVGPSIPVGTCRRVVSLTLRPSYPDSVCVCPRGHLDINCEERESVAFTAAPRRTAQLTNNSRSASEHIAYVMETESSSPCRQQWRGGGCFCCLLVQFDPEHSATRVFMLHSSWSPRRISHALNLLYSL